MQLDDMIRALAGYTILVGKSEKDGRLMVCTVVNRQAKVDYIGNPWSVPNTVSRCQLDKSVAHLKIEIDKQRVVRLTNMKVQNVTYVNGVAIFTKIVNPMCDQVALGANAWQISLIDVLGKAAAMVPAPPKEYSIAHLEHVWNNYKETTDTLKSTQNNLGQLRGGAMIFTMGAGVLATCLKVFNVGDATITFVTLMCTLIGIIIVVYTTIKTKNLDVITKTNEATELFQDTYVCPNPECNHFMGVQAYKILRQNKNCPYCKAIFLEGN